MSDLWWHNIPQHKVGDLVRNKTRYLHPEPQTFIVVETKPVKPCRVEPLQRIRCVRCCDGFETRFSKAEDWAAIGVPA